MLLAGPWGCFHDAPVVHTHQPDMSRRSTGRPVGVNTIEPGRSISSGGLGVPGGTCFFSSSQSTGRSAVVT